MLSDPDAVEELLDGNSDRHAAFTDLLEESFGKTFFVIYTEKEALRLKIQHPIALAGPEWIDSLEPIVVAETTRFADYLLEMESFDLREERALFGSNLLTRIGFNLDLQPVLYFASSL
jgi:hypothetical protein